MSITWLDLLKIEGKDTSGIEAILEAKKTKTTQIVESLFSAHPFVTKTEAKLLFESEYANGKVPKGIDAAFIKEHKEFISEAIAALTEGEINLKFVFNNEMAGKGASMPITIPLGDSTGQDTGGLELESSKPKRGRGRPPKAKEMTEEVEQQEIEPQLNEEPAIGMRKGLRCYRDELKILRDFLDAAAVNGKDRHPNYQKAVDAAIKMEATAMRRIGEIEAINADRAKNGEHPIDESVEQFTKNDYDEEYAENDGIINRLYDELDDEDDECRCTRLTKRLETIGMRQMQIEDILAALVGGIDQSPELVVAESVLKEAEEYEDHLSGKPDDEEEKDEIERIDLSWDDVEDKMKDDDNWPKVGKEDVSEEPEEDVKESEEVDASEDLSDDGAPDVDKEDEIEESMSDEHRNVNIGSNAANKEAIAKFLANINNKTRSGKQSTGKDIMDAMKNIKTEA